MSVTVTIGKNVIGEGNSVYFVADIAANHDGDIGRARALIHLAAEAGASAAKFQNFTAESIVSDYGFEHMGCRLSHQTKWKKKVVDVYRSASVPWEWTSVLKEECARAGIDYFSSPYDFGAVEMLNPFVDVYKVGSGDITWDEMLIKIGSMRKPVILATGASDIGEVQHAVNLLQNERVPLILMQCNTNYTASNDNFKHIHLNVLKAYRVMFPDVVLGLSDHTPGHSTVLGAVALGACAIEKHFTDDNTRDGPDHQFAMDPSSWREMVDRTRELESALGCSRKYVADNELDTVVVQRRCLRAAKDLPCGIVLTRDMVDVLRPAPSGCIAPYDLSSVIGRKLIRSCEKGDVLSWGALD